MQEIWKPIKGHESYEVSTGGRIRHGGKILRGGDNGQGYLRVSFADGNRETIYIHRLVAMAFIENPFNKPCVNHIDNNPSNNNVNNLEWCTKQENTDHMVKQGRNKRTEEWLKNLHKAQAKTFKKVMATSIDTGERLLFDSINSVKESGFSSGNVCDCCLNKYGPRKNIYRGYRWEYAT